MDQKNWLWRKRSSEKTIVSNGDEMLLVPDENDIGTESISLKTLTEELASVLDKKQAENAMADKHEAEEEARRLKDELDQVRKDCVEQLRSHQKLEEKLSQTNKNLSTMTAENSYLTQALLVKEKTNGDLKDAIRQKEAELETLMTRLDSTEKENAFLRYESQSLEKELVHLNEEMECQRFKNSENVKKIKKLEGECQRLCASARKRFLSPGMQGQGRKGLGLTGNDSASKKVRDSERENTILRESLVRKEEEIFSLRRKMNGFSDRLSLASSRSWAASDHNEHESIGASSEMSLMDDFVEMEKLAIEATGSPFSNESKGNDNWIRDVENIISEQHNITKRSVHEILTVVKMALEGNVGPEESKLMPPISGYHHRIVRDEFRKHLGGEGPGTALGLESVQTLMVEMEKMHLAFHAENEGLRNELGLIRSSEGSHRSIASTLQDEVEMLRESKRMAEDQIENLEMVYVDLDTQLTVAKSERNDLLRKLSKSERNENQAEVLPTGMGTNHESSKRLKALAPSNEPPVVDKVMFITDARTSKQQRSSLRDQMIHEDNNNPQSPMRKEIISTTSTNENASYVFSFPDGQEVTTTPEHANARALVVAPTQRRGGWGFMRKLLVKKKKCGSKNIYHGK